jgi:hypothetical protein
MRQQDAPIAYNCYYIASIGYTIKATKLSLNQCKSIQSPVVWATLNKMGINRNIACAIVFGPKILGGLEMHHLYTLQGTKRLQYFMLCGSHRVQRLKRQPHEYLHGTQPARGMLV